MPSLYFLSAALGYLLGSFPTGYLVGRARGIDIREHGSGNIGATNVVRVLGKKLGYLVFLCDALKGWLAVLVGRLTIIYGLFWFHGSVGSLDYDAILPLIRAAIFGSILAAIGCILGHNFPVWLKFRGGKGVATTVGVLLGLMPLAIGVAALVWVTAFYLFRYVSLASLLGAATLPVTVWFLTNLATRQLLSIVGSQSVSTPHGANLDPLFWFSVAAAALIFWRHRSNIGRLLNGTEARFARKTGTPQPPPPPAA